MREYGSNIILPSLDNLFSSEQERQDAKLEKIQILPLSELHPFEGHPFQVRDDEEMDKMVDSVKEYGVMTPAIVRPRRDGGYEIVAGHRQKKMCANLAHIFLETEVRKSLAKLPVTAAAK